MDAPPPLPPLHQPTTAAVNSTTTTKLRLMCSYGGQITTRPQSKALRYAGGETRIVSIPTSTATATSTSNAADTLTLSSLTIHLTKTLNIHYPFMLKYQLPHHHLDSLISLSADEDLQIMLEEYDRLSSPFVPYRIRLFLFPIKLRPARPDSTLYQLTQSGMQQKHGDSDWFREEFTQPVLRNQMTETWFVDASRTARIGPKGGLECRSDANDVGLYGQESIVLETSSSFESSSSSASSANFPPIKGQSDDNVGCLQDNMNKLPSPELTSSASSMATGVSYGYTGAVYYQDQLIHDPAMGSKGSTTLIEFEPNPSGRSTAQVVMVPRYPTPPLMDQPQHHAQAVPTGVQYISLPQNPHGMLPVTSYYPMYYSQQPQPLQQPLQQPPQFHFQSTQPYPFHYVPVGHMDPYVRPIQHGLGDASNIVISAQPQHHPSVAYYTPQVMALKEATSAPYIPESTSQVDPAGQAGNRNVNGNPLVHIPCKEISQPPLSLPETHNHQAQATEIAATREAVQYNSELDADTAQAQLYKSQPPGPVLPSQYQSINKASEVMISDALMQFHVDNSQQKAKTSEPL